MSYNMPPNNDLYTQDKDKIELVIVSVGFDDTLRYTIPENHDQVDHLIVVTSHEDTKTRQLCHRMGVTCVPTDLFARNKRIFNKGAGINRGFDFFKYYGWRAHIDADIILPHNFRRMFLNHVHQETEYLYGMDRVDIVGLDELHTVKSKLNHTPQHMHSFLVSSMHNRPVGSRYLDTQDGYCPIGYFQMWHASRQRSYPCSRGDASHDDVSFAKLWPRNHRHLLPSGVCYHLVPKANQPMGHNWRGKKQPKLK